MAEPTPTKGTTDLRKQIFNCEGAINNPTDYGWYVEKSDDEARLLWFLGAQEVILKELENLPSTTCCCFDSERPCGGECMLFLCGSISRLEYIPGLSDADILILTDSTNLCPNPTEKAEEIVHNIEVLLLAAENALDRYTEEFKMKNNINDKEKVEVIPRFWKRKEIEVEIDGIFEETEEDTRGEGKEDKQDKYKLRRFFIIDDLLGSPGNSREPAWANGHRGSLFFDAAPVTDSPLADKVLQEVIDIYKVLLDIRAKQFPAIGYYFLNSLASTQLLSEVFRARKTDETIDSKVCKLVLSRIWWFKINQILFHMLFWSKFTRSRREWIDNPDVNWFRSSTINKILLFIPQQAKNIMPAMIEKLSEKEEKESDEKEKKEIKTAIEHLEEMRTIILPPKRLSEPKDKARYAEFGLRSMFVQILCLALEIRPSKEALDPHEIKRLQGQCRKLSEFVARAHHVSYVVAKHLSTESSTNIYAMVNDMVAASLFPETCG